MKKRKKENLGGPAQNNFVSMTFIPFLSVFRCFGHQLSRCLIFQSVEYLLPLSFVFLPEWFLTWQMMHTVKVYADAVFLLHVCSPWG